MTDRSAYGREYRSRPEVAARRKAARQTQAYKDYQRAYYRSCRYKATDKKRSTVQERIEGRRLRDRIRRGLPTPTRAMPLLCECCGSPSRDKRCLHLDHDHTTGAFRGWLCDLCNRGLGMFGDNVSGLRAALNYLLRSTTK